MSFIIVLLLGGILVVAIKILALLSMARRARYIDGRIQGMEYPKPPFKDRFMPWFYIVGSIALIMTVPLIRLLKA
jgi:hypothetical protein